MPMPSLGARAMVGEFMCDIVIFLYKIGEALLDASIRPYISVAVCNDMLYDTFGPEDDDDDDDDRMTALLIVKDHYQLRVRGGASFQHGNGNLTVVCSEIQLLQDEIANDVQRRVAGVLVVYRLLVSVPAVILGLFCGAWSDTRGSKLPMMAPSVGSCAAVVLYLLSVRAHHAKVALLLAGAAMQGVFGKTSMITMAVNSQVTHTSDVEQRTRRLSRLLASSYLGMFLGALLAGILQGVSNLSTTLVFVSLCHALCMFAVLLGINDVLSEHATMAKGGPYVTSGSGRDGKIGSDGSGDREVGGGGEVEGGKEDGARKNEHSLFSWGGLRDSVMAVVKKREGDKRGVIVICLVVLTVTQILKIGDQDVTVQFVERPPLSWPPYLYGYLIAADSGVAGLTLLAVLPVLSLRVSLSDPQLMLLGLVFKLARAAWAGFCTRTWMVFASVALGSLGGVVTPGLRSALSKTADLGEVGKLFSIQASLETLSKLIGSGIFSGMYAATVDLFPPAAYLSEVVVYLFMVALLIWLGQLLKEDEAHELLLNTPKPKYSKNEETLRSAASPSSSLSSSSSTTSSSLSSSEKLPMAGLQPGGHIQERLEESGRSSDVVSTP